MSRLSLKLWVEFACANRTEKRSQEFLLWFRVSIDLRRRFSLSRTLFSLRAPCFRCHLALFDCQWNKIKPSSSVNKFIRFNFLSKESRSIQARKMSENILENMENQLEMFIENIRQVSANSAPMILHRSIKYFSYFRSALSSPTSSHRDKLSSIKRFRPSSQICKISTSSAARSRKIT